MTFDVGDTLAAELAAERRAAKLSWGRVTNINPARVRRFGETSEVDASSNGAGPLTMGDRVIVAQQAAQTIIVANPDWAARVEQRLTSIGA